MLGWNDIVEESMAQSLIFSARGRLGWVGGMRCEDVRWNDAEARCEEGVQGNTVWSRGSLLAQRMWEAFARTDLIHLERVRMLNDRRATFSQMSERGSADCRFSSLCSRIDLHGIARWESWHYALRRRRRRSNSWLLGLCSFFTSVEVDA